MTKFNEFCNKQTDVFIRTILSYSHHRKLLTHFEQNLNLHRGWVHTDLRSDISRPFGSPVYRFGRPNSGAQKRFFNFLFEDFFKTSTEKSVSLFNLCNLENVLQRNLKTGTARECIFRASGGARFKNFRQPWWRKGREGTPRCNRSTQKNSGYVTVKW